jgi:hypothetical protein
MRKFGASALGCLFLIFIFSVVVGGCATVSEGPTEEDLQETQTLVLCEALDTFLEFFILGEKEAVFDQLLNDQAVFLFISPNVAAEYDGKNVIRLNLARVDFDFDSEAVDAEGFNTFWSRWIITLVPFDPVLLETYQNSVTPADFDQLITLFQENEDRVETQLSGPFLNNGCEWGNTDSLGSQTLFYEEYGVYDWDFFPNEESLLGIIWEDDGGINDDFITFFEISRDSGTVVLDNPDFYSIEFDAFTDVIF